MESSKKQSDVSYKKVYEKRQHKSMPYRLLKPLDYDPTVSYPLVLSLHGSGGKGTDNEKNLRGPSARVMADTSWREKYPCFVLVPQNTGHWIRPRTLKERVSRDGIEAHTHPKDENATFLKQFLQLPNEYGLEFVFEILESLQSEFNIDPNRLYIFGLSMGGFGTWITLHEEPDMFAAAIPMCGTSLDHYSFAPLRNLPIWILHGEEDSVVPYSWSRSAFEKLKAINGNCKLTTLGGVDHNVWDYVFTDGGDGASKGFRTEYGSDQCSEEGNIWDWLFAQSK